MDSEQYVIINETVKNQPVAIRTKVAALNGTAKDVVTIPIFFSVEEAENYIKDVLPKKYKYGIISFGVRKVEEND